MPLSRTSIRCKKIVYMSSDDLSRWTFTYTQFTLTAKKEERGQYNSQEWSWVRTIKGGDAILKREELEKYGWKIV